MWDQTTKLLMKKVKKHKKWTEGVFVNPVYWMVNGTPYYMAGFTRNNQSVACAYFTIGDEKVDEVLIAQPNLSYFADLSGNLSQMATERLNIPITFYTKPLSIPVVNASPQVQQGRDAFEDFWEVQQAYNQVLRDYTAYYNDDVLIRKHITDTDLTKIKEFAVLADIYQHQTLKILTSQGEAIQAFAAFLENTQEWSSLSREEKKFIKRIAVGKENMQKNMDALNVLEANDFDQMVKLNYDHLINKNKAIIEGQRQYIRYPKGIS
ncbi:hypothetical protein EVJ20_03440 [Exiguobacterium sp. SH0S1]|uniref:hypothetical protein n=1 Tax=Exiguobacterium sp. SH0S1 TaxID=2510949 RepID=UPI00103E30B6|nr:hypothetical protein [Exiguobacterium sp. SH0S1]TCI80379.1 hypothetical protein EVJ20_03440 [Exiguobacterium sp. SH0S1]